VKLDSNQQIDNSIITDLFQGPHALSPRRRYDRKRTATGVLLNRRGGGLEAAPATIEAQSAAPPPTVWRQLVSFRAAPAAPSISMSVSPASPRCWRYGSPPPAMSG